MNTSGASTGSVFVGPDYYRTRDGHKALVGDSGRGYLTGAIIDRLEEMPVSWHWRMDGLSTVGIESGSDLVALWSPPSNQDPSNQGETSAPQSDAAAH